MPSTKSRNAGGQGPLLKTWRYEGPSGNRAKAWLIVRRAAVITVALALLGGLGFLLFRPFFLPRTYFAYLLADEVRVKGRGDPNLAALPIAFAYEDFAGYTKLKDALHPLAVDNELSLLLGRLAEPRFLDKELDAWQDSRLTRRDTLIICIDAHGLVVDGKPFLVCSNYDPVAVQDDPKRGLYSLSKLLTRVDSLPAKTKLLLLDAGRIDYAPRLGMAANAFVEALKTEVESLDLTSTWVLNAYSPGERSHVSRALQRSVFGYVCAAGLQGQANDDDKVLDLNELYRFVRTNVAECVKRITGGRESQTPILLGPVEANVATTTRLHVLYTSGLPPIDPVGNDVTAMDEPRDSVVTLAAKFVTARADEFGVAPLSTMARIATGQGDDDERPGANADDQQDSSDSSTQGRTYEDLKSEERQEVEDAWRLTAQLTADGETKLDHPAAYAPDLWRLHLDRLLWLDSLQQSGELERDVRNWMLRELTDVKRSLEDFGDPEKEPPSSPQDRNVIDNIRLLRPKLPISIDDAPTLALAKSIAETDPKQPLPENIEKFDREYDRWLDSAQDSRRLNEIAVSIFETEEKWSRTRQMFHELRLLDEIDEGLVGLNGLKLALKVRRLAEQVAADPLWGEGWFATAAAEADQLRLEGERLLRNRAGERPEERGLRKLKEAHSAYRSVISQLSMVRTHQLRRIQLLSYLRGYLRWNRFRPDDQRLDGSLQSLVDDLIATLDDAYAPPSGATADGSSSDRNVAADKLLKIQTQLQKQHSTREIAKLTDESVQRGDLAQIDALLTTALLTPSDRDECIRRRLAIEQDLMRDFEFVPVPSTLPVPKTSPEAVAEQFKLEEKLLAKFTDFEPPPDGDVWERSEAIQEALAELPGEITEQIAKNKNLASEAQRPAHLQELRRAASALFLVDAADAAANGSSIGGDLAQALTNAQWYDLLKNARERRQRAYADASLAELEELRDQQRSVEILASQIQSNNSHPQPPLPVRRAAGLTMQITEPDRPEKEVELDAAERAIVQATIYSPVDAPVWILAQYDDSLIDVTGDGLEVISEHRMLADPLGARSPEARSYPYRPQKWDIPASFYLTAGIQRDVTFFVNRKQLAEESAALVLRAISDEDYVRRQVSVRLPGKEDYRLLVTAGNRPLPIDRDAYLLFPNREQDVTLQVSNESGRPKSLVAHVYAPLQMPANQVTIPNGAVSGDAAGRILNRFSRRRTIAKNVKIELPANDTPEPLLLGLGAAEGGTPAGAAADSAKPTNGDPLPYGLLVVIEDSEGEKDVLIRWLRFKVREPRDYLQAWAQINGGVLNVTIEAKDPQQLPAGSVETQLKIDKAYMSFGDDRVEKDLVSRSQPRTKLFVPLTEGRWPEKSMRVYVDADRYPRAFAFEIPQATDSRPIPPNTDRTDIRISSPADGFVFPKRDWIETNVAVDVPTGFFARSGNRVEIGVDKDADRDLSNDVVRDIDGDRYRQVFARPPASDSTTIRLKTIVSDWSLPLRTDGILGQVNILGQIVPGRQQDAVKARVEIFLDGDGPTFGRTRTRQIGDEIVASYFPQDKSKISLLKAAFDLPGLKDDDWKEGKSMVDGRWEVRLNVAEMLPGEYTLLARAWDRVKNPSTLKKNTITIERAPKPPTNGADAKPKEKIKPVPVTNQLTASVTNGRNRVEILEVELTGPDAPAAPDQVEGGEIVYEKLKPGKYVLTVRAESTNATMYAQAKFTISDKRNTPKPVTLPLKRTRPK